VNKHLYLCHLLVLSSPTSFNRLADKAELERRSDFETYELFIDGDIHWSTKTFCENPLTISTYQPRF